MKNISEAIYFLTIDGYMVMVEDRQYHLDYNNSNILVELILNRLFDAGTPQ